MKAEKYRNEENVNLAKSLFILSILSKILIFIDKLQIYLRFAAFSIETTFDSFSISKRKEIIFISRLTLNIKKSYVNL